MLKPIGPTLSPDLLCVLPAMGDVDDIGPPRTLT
jgi:L-fucose mutarotase/ribose pyranase (RbsD/FucU family)